MSSQKSPSQANQSKVPFWKEPGFKGLLLKRQQSRVAPEVRPNLGARMYWQDQTARVGSSGAPLWYDPRTHRITTRETPIPAIHGMAAPLDDRLQMIQELRARTQAGMTTPPEKTTKAAYPPTTETATPSEAYLTSRGVGGEIRAPVIEGRPTTPRTTPEVIPSQPVAGAGTLARPAAPELPTIRGIPPVSSAAETYVRARGTTPGSNVAAMAERVRTPDYTIYVQNARYVPSTVARYMGDYELEPEPVNIHQWNPVFWNLYRVSQDPFQYAFARTESNPIVRLLGAAFGGGVKAILETMTFGVRGVAQLGLGRLSDVLGSRFPALPWTAEPGHEGLSSWDAARVEVGNEFLTLFGRLQLAGRHVIEHWNESVDYATEPGAREELLSRSPLLYRGEIIPGTRPAGRAGIGLQRTEEARQNAAEVQLEENRIANVSLGHAVNRIAELRRLEGTRQEEEIDPQEVENLTAIIDQQLEVLFRTDLYYARGIFAYSWTTMADGEERRRMAVQAVRDFILQRGEMPDQQAMISLTERFVDPVTEIVGQSVFETFNVIGLGVEQIIGPALLSPAFNRLRRIPSEVTVGLITKLTETGHASEASLLRWMIDETITSRGRRFQSYFEHVFGPFLRGEGTTSNDLGRAMNAVLNAAESGDTSGLRAFGISPGRFQEFLDSRVLENVTPQQLRALLERAIPDLTESAVEYLRGMHPEWTDDMIREAAERIGNDPRNVLSEVARGVGQAFTDRNRIWQGYAPRAPVRQGMLGTILGRSRIVGEPTTTAILGGFRISRRAIAIWFDFWRGITSFWRSLVLRARPAYYINNYIDTWFRVYVEGRGPFDSLTNWPIPGELRFRFPMSDFAGQADVATRIEAGERVTAGSLLRESFRHHLGPVGRSGTRPDQIAADIVRAGLDFAGGINAATEVYASRRIYSSWMSRNYRSARSLIMGYFQNTYSGQMSDEARQVLEGIIDRYGDSQPLRIVAVAREISSGRVDPRSPVWSALIPPGVRYELTRTLGEGPASRLMMLITTDLQAHASDGTLTADAVGLILDEYMDAARLEVAASREAIAADVRAVGEAVDGGMRPALNPAEEDAWLQQVYDEMYGKALDDAAPELAAEVNRRGDDIAHALGEQDIPLEQYVPGGRGTLRTMGYDDDHINALVHSGQMIENNRGIRLADDVLRRNADVGIRPWATSGFQAGQRVNLPGNVINFGPAEGRVGTVTSVDDAGRILEARDLRDGSPLIREGRALTFSERMNWQRYDADAAAAAKAAIAPAPPVDVLPDGSIAAPPKPVPPAAATSPSTDEALAAIQDGTARRLGDPSAPNIGSADNPAIRGESEYYRENGFWYVRGAGTDDAYYRVTEPVGQHRLDTAFEEAQHAEVPIPSGGAGRPAGPEIAPGAEAPEVAGPAVERPSGVQTHPVRDIQGRPANGSETFPDSAWRRIQRASTQIDPAVSRQLFHNGRTRWLSAEYLAAHPDIAELTGGAHALTLGDGTILFWRERDITSAAILHELPHQMMVLGDMPDSLAVAARESARVDALAMNDLLLAVATGRTEGLPSDVITAANRLTAHLGQTRAADDWEVVICNSVTSTYRRDAAILGRHLGLPDNDQYLILALSSAFGEGRTARVDAEVIAYSINAHDDLTRAMVAHLQTQSNEIVHAAARAGVRPTLFNEALAVARGLDDPDLIPLAVSGYIRDRMQLIPSMLGMTEAERLETIADTAERYVVAVNDYLRQSAIIDEIPRIAETIVPAIPPANPPGLARAANRIFSAPAPEATGLVLRDSSVNRAIHILHDPATMPYDQLDELLEWAGDEEGMVAAVEAEARRMAQEILEPIRRETTLPPYMRTTESLRIEMQSELTMWRTSEPDTSAYRSAQARVVALRDQIINHENAVIDAIHAGQTVPPEVLELYTEAETLVGRSSVQDYRTLADPGVVSSLNVRPTRLAHRSTIPGQVEGFGTAWSSRGEMIMLGEPPHGYVAEYRELSPTTGRYISRRRYFTDRDEFRDFAVANEIMDTEGRVHYVRRDPVTVSEGFTRIWHESIDPIINNPEGAAILYPMRQGPSTLRGEERQYVTLASQDGRSVALIPAEHMQVFVHQYGEDIVFRSLSTEAPERVIVMSGDNPVGVIMPLNRAGWPNTLATELHLPSIPPPQALEMTRAVGPEDFNRLVARLETAGIAANEEIANVEQLRTAGFADDEITDLQSRGLLRPPDDQHTGFWFDPEVQQAWLIRRRQTATEAAAGVVEEGAEAAARVPPVTPAEEQQVANAAARAGQDMADHRAQVLESRGVLDSMGAEIQAHDAQEAAEMANLEAIADAENIPRPQRLPPTSARQEAARELVVAMRNMSDAVLRVADPSVPREVQTATHLQLVTLNTFYTGPMRIFHYEDFPGPGSRIPGLGYRSISRAWRNYDQARAATFRGATEYAREYLALIEAENWDEIIRMYQAGEFPSGTELLNRTGIELLFENGQAVGFRMEGVHRPGYYNNRQYLIERLSYRLGLPDVSEASFSEPFLRHMLPEPEVLTEAVEASTQAARRAAEGSAWEAARSWSGRGIPSANFRFANAKLEDGRGVLDSYENFLEYTNLRIQRFQTAGRYADADAATAFRDSVTREYRLLLSPTTEAGEPVTTQVLTSDLLPAEVRRWLHDMNTADARVDRLEGILDSWRSRLTEWVQDGSWMVQPIPGADLDNFVGAAQDMTDQFLEAHRVSSYGSAHLAGDAFHGQAFEGATQRTQRALIDYGTVSNIEDLGKNAYPFILFPTRSLPYWLETMVLHPQIPSIYAKYLELSRLYSFERGAVNSRGQQLPSMVGYIPIPGVSNFWFNPLAPLSFRYAMPVDSFARLQYDDATEGATPMQMVANFIYNYGSLFGLSNYPWLLLMGYSTGVFNHQQFPRGSIIPQTGLIPPYIQRSISHSLQRIGFENIPDIWSSQVPWMDYLVNRRILERTLNEINVPGMTDAQRRVRVELARQAINPYGENSRATIPEALELWEEGRDDIEQSEWVRRFVGYFTSVYMKEFSVDRAAMYQLRDEVNTMAHMLNDQVGATIFDDMPDVANRWKWYLERRYDTPEGDIIGMYKMIGWTPADMPANEYVHQAILEDNATEARFMARSAAYERFNTSMASLPVGAPWDQVSPIWTELFETLTQVDTDTMYDPARREWVVGYKPELMVWQDFRNLWWSMIRGTQPNWDPSTGETYTEFEQRQQQWLQGLPNLTITPTRRPGSPGGIPPRGPMAAFIARLDQYAWSDEAVNRPEAMVERLTAETNAVGYQAWELENDTVYQALDTVWRDRYWKVYWETLGTYSNEDRILAEREFLTRFPTQPSTELLIQWVQQTYPNRFSVDELTEAITGRTIYSTQDRILSGAGDLGVQQEQIWDILGRVGPGELRNDFIQAMLAYDSSADDDYNTWMSIGGQGDAFHDPERFQTFFNAVVAAARDVGLGEPTDAELRDRSTARRLNDEFNRQLVERFGEQIYNAQAYYYNLDYADRRVFAEANPEVMVQIQAVQDMKDAYALAQPLWARYYRPDVAAAGGGGGGGGGRGAGTTVRAPAYVSGYVPIGARSTMDVRQLLAPGAVGRASPTKDLVWPKSILKKLGKEATDDISDLVNGTPLPDATRLFLKRAMEWNDRKVAMVARQALEIDSQLPTRSPRGTPIPRSE